MEVKDASCMTSLSWDRYVRLKAAAEAISELLEPGAQILDVGGYDGAIAFFLPGFEIDLLDPSTTGACFLEEPAGDKSYELVSAVDVLEHIEPSQRQRFLAELARVARKHIVLNYPGKHTAEAQSLVLKATGNPLVREHVDWELPENDWVMASLAELSFSGTSRSHASLAVWLGQYIVHNIAPSLSQELNRFLVENHADEPFSTGLYELLVFTTTTTT